MAGPNAEEQVSLVLDPASVQGLIQEVTTAFFKAFGSAQKAINPQVAQIGRTTAKSIGLAGTAAQNNTTQFIKMGKAATGALTPASKEAVALVQALQSVVKSSGEVIAAVNKSSTVQRRQSVERTQQTSDAARLEIEELRNVGRVANIEGQKAVVVARGAAKQRLAVTQELMRTIGRLEKGLGVTIAGIARTSVSAVSRTFSGLGSILRRSTRGIDEEMRRTTGAVERGMRRTNQEFNSGLSASLNRRESTLRQSFIQQERIVSRSVLRQQEQFAKLRTATSTGVAGVVSGRGIGGGLLAPLAGVAGASALLTSGFQRFSDLERINKQFLALTGNITDTNNLMEQVKEFAKQTPFDLVGVADLAKGFLAIKTPIDQVLPRVRAIADAVALTGGGVQQLDRIQRAIGQVVSTGKLQGDELNQLAENLPGLNIRQILADQLTGGNVAALVELQESGKISGQQFVDGLITGLQQDTRLVGASEDLAKTLSGRVANLKESFADFGASLIGLIAAPLKQVILVVQTGLQSLADFIKGENLSGPLIVLRDALKGVALGLLAVVAAKGAVETLKLLGTAAKLALTPFGGLLLVAGLVGGAIAVLAKRSEPFREAISGLVERVQDLGGVIGGQIIKGLDALGGVIERNVLPFVISLSTWVGEHLVDAFKTTVRFIDDKVVPALRTAGEFIARIASVGFRAVVGFVRDHVIPTLKTFVNFVVDDVAPTVVQVGGILAGAFTNALDAVQRFWAWVEPVLRPMLDGFKELGGAIAAIFTGGDFSQLGSGFAAVGSGIASSFAGIGRNLLSVLDDLWVIVSGFFKRVFSGPNLIALGKGFLDFVEFVGNTLGSIVTSPAFVQGVALLAAGLAAAAALIAVRFIEGFGRAFLSNLPGLFDLISDAFIAGLVAIFKNPLIAVGIAVAIAGILRVANIVKGFTAAGAQAGGGFLSGFAASLKAAPRNIRDQLTGLFGGGLNANNAKGSGKFFKQQLADMDVLQRKLRAVGSTMQLALNPKSLREGRIELQNYTRGMSDATIKGLLLRDSFKQFSGIGTTLFRDLRRGVSEFGTSLRESFALQRALAKPIKDDPFLLLGKNATPRFQAITEQARITARNIGRSFDGIRLRGMQAFDSIKTSAKVATNTASTSGKMLARSFNLSFDGIRLRGMAIFDGLKSSQVGKIAGAGATAFSTAFSKGFSTIKAAFGTAMDGLRVAAQERARSLGLLIVKGIQGALTAAVFVVGGFLAGKAEGEAGGSGIASALLAGLTAAALTGNPIIGVAAGISAAVGAHFGKAAKKVKDFNEEVKRLASTFSDTLVDAIEAGGVAVDGLDFSDVAGVNVPNVRQAFTDQLKGLSEAQAAILASTGLTLDVDIIPRVLASGGDKEAFARDVRELFSTQLPTDAQFQQLFGVVNAADVFRTLTNALLGGSDAQKQFAKDTLGTVAVLVKAGNAGITALNVAEKLAPALAKIPSLEAVTGFAGHGRQPEEPFHDLAAAVNNVLIPAMRDAQIESALTFQNLVKLGLGAEEANAELLQLGLPPIPQSIIDDWNTQLGKVQTKAENLRAALEAVPDELGQVVAGLISTPVEVAAAQAEVDVIADTKVVFNATTNAESVLALHDLAKEATASAVQAIIDGTVINPEQLLSTIQPLRDAALAALIDPDTGVADPTKVAAVNKIFDDLFATVSPEIPDIVARKVATDFTEKVAAELAKPENAFKTTAQVTFELTADVVIARNLGHGLTTDVPTQTSLLSDLLPTAAEAKALTAPVGVNLLHGIAVGLEDKGALEAISRASFRAAQHVRTVIDDAFGIKSPSKVMMETGGHIAQGLADGIDAGSSAAADAAVRTAQEVIDAARSVIDDSPLKLGFQSTAVIDKRTQEAIDRALGHGVSFDPNQSPPIVPTRTPVIPTPLGVGREILERAQLGTRVHPGDDAGALRMTESDLVTLARLIAAESKPNVNVDQTFNTPVDSRAVATDIAWRLTDMRPGSQLTGQRFGLQ